MGPLKTLGNQLKPNASRGCARLWLWYQGNDSMQAYVLCMAMMHVCQQCVRSLGNCLVQMANRTSGHPAVHISSSMEDGMYKALGQIQACILCN